MIKTGDKAPSFHLPNQKKEMVSLESLKGKKVVLAFYPAAFTSVCTKEMCSFTDSLTELNAVNAVVLGVSVDPPFSNAAFAEKNRIGFALLSDYKREATRAYDVALDDFAGMPGYTAAKRAVFVIDGAGIVRYTWVGANPGIEPSYDEVKKAVEALG
jgi:peroxiredoxin